MEVVTGKITQLTLQISRERAPHMSFRFEVVFVPQNG